MEILKIMERTKYIQLIKWVGAILCVGFGISIIFSNLYYCEFSGDEGYQALCVKHYKDSPLALMLFFNGYVWTNIFGFSLLSLRIFARICYLFAITAGCLYEFRRTGNVVITALTFLICCLISNLSGFGIYNWDTGAYPIEALWCLCLVLYCQRPSGFKLIVLSILCGLMTATRLPLVSSIAVVICAIFFMTGERRKLQKLRDSIICVLVTIVVYILVGVAIEGDLNSLYHSFNSENYISGHGVKAIDNYFWRLKVLLPFVLLSWVPVICCFMMANNADRSHFKRYLILGLIVCVISGWCILRVSAIHEGYDHPIFGLGTPLLLVVIILLPFYKLFNISRLGNYDVAAKKISLILLGAMLVVGLGSDAMFERWTVIFLFPISVGVIYPCLTKRGYRVINLWVAYVLATLLFMWGYKSLKSPQSYSWPKEEISTRGGLPIYKEMYPIFREMPRDIEILESNGKTYTFWGFYRFPLTLEYEKNPAYTIQLFHYPDYDISETIRDINNLDYIFLTYHLDEKEIKKNIGDLSKSGFRIVKKGSNYFLMENIRK